jgi:hypothetical protein
MCQHIRGPDVSGLPSWRAQGLDRAMPGQQPLVYQKDEAVEPLQIVIILRYLGVVVTTILRRVSAI